MPKDQEVFIAIIPAAGVKGLPKAGTLVARNKEGDLRVRVEKKQGRSKQVTVQTYTIPRCAYSTYFEEHIADAETGEVVAAVAPKATRRKSTNGRKKAAKKTKSAKSANGRKKRAKKSGVDGRTKAARAAKAAAGTKRGPKSGRKKAEKTAAPKKGNSTKTKTKAVQMPWGDAADLGDDAFQNV
jgi:hypothetical protein